LDIETTINPETCRTSGTLAIGLVLLTALASATVAQLSSERSGFEQVVSFHVEKYPVMEIEDLFKLAFQAAMGSEHAVSSREAAGQWLERELSSLSKVQGEPLSEPLSPDGLLVRVNIRALVERGGDTSGLVDAFVRTANEFEGSQERLERYWIIIEGMAAAGNIPFEVDRLQAMWRKMKFQGFPAVHHSTTYRDQYHPAYRVVLLELLE
jgi:hypothetical protein